MGQAGGEQPSLEQNGSGGPGQAKAPTPPSRAAHKYQVGQLHLWRPPWGWPRMPIQPTEHERSSELE
eukprot:4603018-Alexandrium_andersonii.AAC.1